VQRAINLMQHAKAAMPRVRMRRPHIRGAGSLPLSASYSNIATVLM